MPKLIDGTDITIQPGAGDTLTFKIVPSVIVDTTARNAAATAQTAANAASTASTAAQTAANSANTKADTAITTANAASTAVADLASDIESLGTNLPFYDIRDYGATTGAVNNQTTIQAAIDAASAAGGGRVFVPQGTWNTGPLVIKRRVWFEGATMRGTVLRLVNGSNADFITNYVSSNGTTDPNAQFIGILNMTLDCNGANQTSGRGIYLSQNPAFGQPSGDDMTDPRHLIQNVMIRGAKGNGFEEANGRSETRLINVHAFYCGGYGFRPGPDSNFIGCVAGATGGQGFYITRSSIRLVNCKVFFCGDAVGGTDGTLGIGYHLSGARGVNIHNCEAQDCKAEGLVIDNYSWNNRVDVTLDSNSKRGFGLHAAFKLGPSYRNKVDIVSFERNDPADGVYAQQHALDIATGEDAFSNTIDIIHGHGAGGVTVGTAIKPSTNTAALVSRNKITVNSQGAFRAPSYAANFTPDPYMAGTYSMTLTGNTTIAATTNHHAGTEMTFIFTQDGTGGRTVTWNAQYKVNWTPVTTAGKVNSITFVYDGTNWVQRSAQVDL